MADKKILVTQTRSSIGHVRKQRRTLKALGLGKIGRTIEHSSTPTVLGMINSVSHLVQIEAVKGK